MLQLFLQSIIDRRRRLHTRLGVAWDIVRRAEEMLEKSLGRVQEVTGNEEVLGLSIADLLNALPVEVVQDGTRIAQNDWRMCRDQKLRVSGRRELVDDLEERELALW